MVDKISNVVIFARLEEIEYVLYQISRKKSIKEIKNILVEKRENLVEELKKWQYKITM